MEAAAADNLFLRMGELGTALPQPTIDYYNQHFGNKRKAKLSPSTPATPLTEDEIQKMIDEAKNGF
jgi:hypothetical protein